MARVWTIVIRREMRASPEYVFDSVADGTRLAALSPMVRSIELLREGAPVVHGAGALRRVDVWPVLLEEEVMGFDRPRRFDYMIRRARPPFTHHGGSLVTEPAAGDGGGTRVTWTTKLSVDVPLVGAVAGFVLAAVLRASLTLVLIAIDRRFAAG